MQTSDQRDSVVSRRGVLAGAAAATAAAGTAQLWHAETAEAAYRPPVRPYKLTRVPTVATRHMANRFAYGYTPELGRQIRAAGGASAWFERQLKPLSIGDSQAADFASWFPTLGRTAKDHFARAQRDKKYVYQAMINEARWTLLRRTYSNRQVHEVMTEFWLNHLHVAGRANLTWLWRHSYDAMIRTHALGRFDQMLKAAIQHPTMLTYLDADVSQIERRELGNGDIRVTERINENLGRELLELHTVGRTTGYDETDVRDSAYLLTGWTVDRYESWACSYKPSRHYTKPVSVLGFSDANPDRDGRAVLNRYLDYLAHHPATAQRIARKLAIRFVSDDPSPALVNHLAGVFLSSGTDIKTTMRALVATREFQDSVGGKVRTPTDDIAATIRVMGARITKPTREADAANAIYYLSHNIGSVPFGWGRPDGSPEVSDAWSSAGRMMGSYRIHNGIAGHWWPSTGVAYRSHASWLPKSRIRFDQLVDHMSRRIFGRPSSSALLGAACIVSDCSPGEIITRDHGLVKWRMARLIGLLLDSPQHMTK